MHYQKILATIFLIYAQIFSFQQLEAQEKVLGFYEFSNTVTYRTIDIRPDSTFVWTMGMEKRSGKWKIEGDSLELSFAKDTVFYHNASDGKLVISDTVFYEEEKASWYIMDSITLNPDIFEYNISEDSTSSFVTYAYWKRVEYDSTGMVNRQYQGNLLEKGRKWNVLSRSYNSGAKKWISQFENGRKDGIEILFHPNNAIKAIGEWRKGKRVSKWKFYDECGRLRSVIKGRKVDLQKMEFQCPNKVK